MKGILGKIAPKALTFDCYGTLVDWEAGIKKTLTHLLLGKGSRVDVNSVFRTREDIEFDLIQADYKPYRDVLALSLKEAFDRFGVPYNGRDGEELAHSVPSWPVFEETKPSLLKLASKHKLGIISNIDNDIIAKTRDRIGVKFDLIVTAQDARAYKPSIRPFQLALERLEIEPSDILHISSGFRYDIPPAHQLGFRTAWINRKRERQPSGAGADQEFPSLAELAAFLT